MLQKKIFVRPSDLPEILKFISFKIANKFKFSFIKIPAGKFTLKILTIN